MWLNSFFITCSCTAFSAAVAFLVTAKYIRMETKSTSATNLNTIYISYSHCSQMYESVWKYKLASSQAKQSGPLFPIMHVVFGVHSQFGSDSLLPPFWPFLHYWAPTQMLVLMTVELASFL